MKKQDFTRYRLRGKILWSVPTALLCASVLFGDGTNDEIKSNYVIVGGTFTDLDGSETAWRAREQRTSDVYGGIEALHYETELGDDWLMSTDARGIIDQYDYSARLVFEKPDFNRTTFSFETFRIWSDARTVDIDGASLIEPFDPLLALDRSRLFVETTFFPNEALDITLSYTLREREGKKASTCWADSRLTPSGDERKVIPSFRDLDEIVHTVELEVEHRGDQTEIDGALRWDYAEQDNSLNIARRFGEPSDQRFVEHSEKMQTDTLMANGSIEHRFSKKLTATVSSMYSRLSGDLSGDRIYGANSIYDPVFGSANNLSRFDHGFLDLAGDFDYDQYVATFGMLYQPSDHWFITPSLRFESTSQDADAIETETSGDTDGTVLIGDDFIGRSQKDFDSAAAEVGIRYDRFTNWTLYANAFASYGEGNLEEMRFDTLDPLNPEVDRDTDYERMMTKFTLGANWYAHRKATVTFQVYHRENDNEYDHQSLNPNDYPGYITDHETSTDDFNIRLNWRVLKNLTSITRFDYQDQKIDAKAFDTSFIESGQRKRFIYSENLTYQATQRLNLFGSINFVQDTLSTPGSDFYQDQSTAVVAESRMDYTFGQLTAAYAYNNTTDITISATGLLSDNYYNNSAVTVPYGNDIEEFSATATVSKWLDTNKRITIEYGYYDYTDGATSDSDYVAHTISAKYEHHF